MIDLQYAKKAFENYLNDYDRKNEKCTGQAFW